MDCLSDLSYSTSAEAIYANNVFKQCYSTTLHCTGNSLLITIYAYQLKLRTLGGKVRTALPARRRILVPFSVTSSV